MPKSYEQLTAPTERRNPKEYWVEVESDDQAYFARVAEHEYFPEAAADYERIIKRRPDMRVVLRHFSHVHRHYVPARLQPFLSYAEAKSSYDGKE